MGTGRVSGGNTCPRCSDMQRQDVLDVSRHDGMMEARLFCVQCEFVWTIRPSDWEAFWKLTWVPEDVEGCQSG